MKLLLWLVCLSLVFVVVPAYSKADTPAQTAKAVSDWCEIEYPTAVVAGDKLEVKITPKGIGTAPTKLAVDLDWMKKDGNFGGVIKAGPRRDAAGGKAEQYTFTVENKEELGGVIIVTYLSPDGSWDSRTKLAQTPTIPATVAAPKAEASAPAKLVKATCDWCEMEYMPTVAAGSKLDIKITPKGLGEAPGKLAVDLHWKKKDGSFGGVMNVGPRRDPVNGKAEQYTLVVENKPDLAGVIVVLYLSSDGTWDNRTKSAQTPTITATTH